MLWVTPNGVGLYNKLSQTNPVAKKTNYEALCDLGLVPVVNLNPWTVRPGKGVVRNDGSASQDFADPAFADRMCEEARQVAARFRSALWAGITPLERDYPPHAPSLELTRLGQTPHLHLANNCAV